MKRQERAGGHGSIVAIKQDRLKTMRKASNFSLYHGNPFGKKRLVRLEVFMC
jgi:hypothetical protein